MNTCVVGVMNTPQSFLSPNFLSPRDFGLIGIDQEPALAHVVPFSHTVQNTGQRFEGVQKDWMSFLPQLHWFRWYFLVCGVALLIYVLFPFWPSLEWELSLLNDRVKQNALNKAATRILAQQDDLNDSVVGYLPVNGGTVLDAQEVNRSAIKTSPAVAKKSIVSYQILSSPKAIQQRVIPTAQAQTAKETIVLDNRIVIPSIKVNAPIVEGNEKALEKGVWLLPKTAYPGNGNAVMSAHRTKEFYHLGKLKVGDEVIVYWQGQQYRYRVKKNYTVKPDALEILNKTSNSQLTLFTCEPLISMARRIVVVAEQM